MPAVAILGAGAIGAAVAHRLAERNRTREIRLIDDAAAVAAGKALDIRQAGPIECSDTSISGTGDVLSAAGADVVVVADAVTGGEWEGDRGLALIQQLVRGGCTAPIVFPGPRQTWLMEAASRELHIASDRLIGTAASAVENVVSSLLHIETGLTGACVRVAGRPPSFVVGWTAATIGGRLVTDVVPPHRLLAISQSMQKLWPVGPEAIAAPTALVVEALISGSRQPLTAAVIADGEYGVRGRAAMLTVEFGNGRVLRRSQPSQSPQEQTETGSAILKRS